MKFDIEGDDRRRVGSWRAIRRSVAAGLGALPLVVAVALPSHARELDPSDPKDSLTIARKIACSTEDGVAVTYWWHGRAYSRRQGERDRLLFHVEGMNTRACVSTADPARGDGYRMVSRELLIYRDPETGAALATWDNPWTGETVPVLHVANDPVNFVSYEKDRSGEPARWTGFVTEGKWRQSTTVPLFYPNPLGGDFQAEVGGTYHATEMFNFMGDARSLLDSETDSARAHVGWSRMSDWLPWMKMGGREGAIYMHTAGLKLSSWDALPDSMKAEIEAHYPAYREPPPLTDDRPNVTSWIYYQRVSDGTEEAPVR